jgi:excinuclease ABC subunit C
MPVKNTREVPLGPPTGQPVAASDASPDVPATREPRQTGPDVIQRYLKVLPGSPGVYRMMDGEGNVLYVGKARNLKARVTSYARLGGHTNRIARMILATAAMEFVSTRTESEALLLEANYIKRFRPRFNVLMRDDKSFPYILIARDHKAPQILKHRGARNRKGDYFGPFASAGAVNNTINTLQRAFLLRSCSDAVFESRTRPCLLYQIKRCSGPCTGEIGLPAYELLVEEATQFLRGESQSVRKHLQQLMAEASDKLEFERAVEFRNRLRAISHVTSDQNVNPEGIEEADVFAAWQEGGLTCVQVFFFRTGQNWGNRAYFPRADRSVPVEEVLESFIAQFYDDKPVARLVLVSHDFPSRELMAEALSTKAARRVEIRVPERGEKRGLIEHALANAREAHGRRLAESSSQRRLLEAMVPAFGLSRAPRRIEVFDNSHIQGANAVGAMIVAGADGFVKAQYRKFNIKSEGLAPGDDYAMMREVLTRRFARLVKESAEGMAEPAGSVDLVDTVDDADGCRAADEVHQVQNVHPGEAAEPEVSGPEGLAPSDRIKAPAPPPLIERGSGAIAFDVLRVDENASETAGDLLEEEPEEDAAVFPDWPDLVLIDGGPGQLAVAHEVLASLGIEDVVLVGVAKGPERDAGREHFHMQGRQSFMLEPRDPVLYFVQRLRDEAHRFAIGSHRARRAKAISANPLDEIAGIGPKRRRALLKHFGSAKAVSRAAIADLLQVEGISQSMAQAIYDHFHERER